MHAGWLPNYFNTNQTTSTFENKNVTRCNLRIFTTIFSAEKNKNIQPKQANQYSYKKARVQEVLDVYILRQV